MSPRRLWFRVVADLGAAATLLAAFFVTHLPTPSGVGGAPSAPQRRAVRGVWMGMKEVALRASEIGPELPDLIKSDKTIHILIFLGPGLFLTWSLAARRRLSGRSAAFLLAALWAWGAFDEGTQALLGRDGELGDVVANGIGATMGVVAGSAAVALVRRARG